MPTKSSKRGGDFARVIQFRSRPVAIRARVRWLAGSCGRATTEPNDPARCSHKRRGRTRFRHLVWPQTLRAGDEGFATGAPMTTTMRRRWISALVSRRETTRMTPESLAAENDPVCPGFIGDAQRGFPSTTPVQCEALPTIAVGPLSVAPTPRMWRPRNSHSIARKPNPKPRACSNSPRSDRAAASGAGSATSELPEATAVIRLVPPSPPFRKQHQPRFARREALTAFATSRCPRREQRLFDPRCGSRCCVRSETTFGVKGGDLPSGLGERLLDGSTRNAKMQNSSLKPSG